MPVISNPGILGATPQIAANYPARTVAGIEVVDLPGGPFMMGGVSKGDAPAHWVRLSPVSVVRRPVTTELYASVMGGEVKEGTEGHPVVEVSALEADDFVARFNERNWSSPYRSVVPQFRLLTEAEWEYAARGEAVDLRTLMKTEGIRESEFVDWARRQCIENVFAHCLGSTFIYNDFERDDFQAVLRSGAYLGGYWTFGHSEGLDDGRVWYCQGRITSVMDRAAERRANSFNLIDMVGNVWEWVADGYIKDAYSTLSPIDPVSKRGANRVIRGGSGFVTYSDPLRAACRGSDPPDHRNYDLGFRLALAGSQD